MARLNMLARTSLGCAALACVLIGCGRVQEADARAQVAARPAPIAAPATREILPAPLKERLMTACDHAGPGTLAASAPGRIVFGPEARMVLLAPTCGPVAAMVKAAAPGTRFLLVVEDLRASTQPGALFDLTLAPSHHTQQHVGVLGTLNFFAAHRPGGDLPRSTSYNVTEQLRHVARSNRLAGGVAIMITPTAAPQRGSDASAAGIKLIAQ